MAILEILEAPHPILAQNARPVRPDEFGPDLERLLSDMAETMYAAPGVGLAAPQVGDLRRLVVCDPGAGEEDEGRTLYLMVNPVIVQRSKEMIEGDEQCLSVPEIVVRVKRHFQITLEWLDPKGNPRSESFEDWPAIVLQHELDHLQGSTLYDRASSLKRSRYLRTRKKAMAAELAR